MVDIRVYTFLGVSTSSVNVLPTTDGVVPEGQGLIHEVEVAPRIFFLQVPEFEETENNEPPDWLLDKDEAPLEPGVAAALPRRATVCRTVNEVNTLIAKKLFRRLVHFPEPSEYHSITPIRTRSSRSPPFPLPHTFPNYVSRVPHSGIIISHILIIDWHRWLCRGVSPGWPRTQSYVLV
ncbi:hypothetical protein HPB47_003513 [Ixodes persulcatus]|uniref:Uncharacterized protein n=1 Tax=Ixodes persulcatus TaxID=34615 RepID=A0AC60PI64_IXOPE|nr:hypothetical protein HPB47_003513 [Ixodes persulcatus]